MKRVFFGIGQVISLILLLTALCAAFAEDWLIRSWSNLSADEVLFHTKVSLEGTNPNMLWEVLLCYVSRGVLLFCILAGAFFYLKKKRIKGAGHIGLISLTFALLIFIFCLVRLENAMGLPGMAAKWCFAGSGSEDFIADHYTEPAKVKLTFPEKKRNLIYIYLESAEVTFTDQECGGAFSENILPNLTKLAQENECFSGGGKKLNGADSLSGSIWTMGAIFAQTTGLPLQVSPFAGKMDVPGGFFPKVTALGDILKQEGYSQSFLLGSKAGFGGRKSYFEQHGDVKILDYDRALAEGKIPEDYYVWWGFEDEKLFSFAKEELLRESASGQPFAMTILTVDTHFPDGYVCDLCREEYGEDRYANVFACQDRQVSEFVNWLKEQDFYEDTTIILAGDHPTMDPNFCAKLDPSYERKTYVSVIGAAGEGKEKAAGPRQYSTMDLFPTTLAAMGVSIEGDRLGLGTNLYSEKPTLLEKFGLAECNKKLSEPSLFLRSLAKR